VFKFNYIYLLLFIFFAKKKNTFIALHFTYKLQVPIVSLFNELLRDWLLDDVNRVKEWLWLVRSFCSRAFDPASWTQELFMNLYF